MALMNTLRQRAKLAGGGGSSNDGGMLEQCVASLEGDMREVKASLGRIETLLRGADDRLRRAEVDMAELKGRISQLPTSWRLFTGGFGLILATSGFAFAVVRLGLPH